MITLSLSGPLRDLTDGLPRIEVETDSDCTLAALVVRVGERFPELGDAILDSSGNVRLFVNVVVDGANVSALNAASCLVPSSASVKLLFSVSGG